MSQPPRRAQSPAAAAALPIIERLIATIEAENRDLEQGRRVKYEAYSQSKNQGLLELSRLIPALAAQPRPDRCAMRWLNFSPSSRSIGRRWRSNSKLAKRSRRSSPAPSRTANPTEPTLRLPGAGRENDQGHDYRRRSGRRRDRGRDGRRQSRRHAPDALDRRCPRTTEARKTHEINVPRIKGGAIKGYAVMLLSYTVDLSALKTAAMAPDSILVERRFAMSTAMIRSTSITSTASISPK